MLKRRSLLKDEFQSPEQPLRTLEPPPLPKGSVSNFSEAVKDLAYERSGGRCECVRQDCWHVGRCRNTFTRNGDWEARRIWPKGADTLYNCQVLCLECYERSNGHWPPPRHLGEV